MSSYQGEDKETKAAKVQKCIHFRVKSRWSLHQETLRMPEQRSNELDVRKNWNSTNGLKRIRMLSNEYEVMTRQHYVELNDAICSRLTLFNVCRGGEPSCTKILKMRWKFDGSTSRELKPWKRNCSRRCWWHFLLIVCFVLLLWD